MILKGGFQLHEAKVFNCEQSDCPDLTIFGIIEKPQCSSERAKSPSVIQFCALANTYRC